MMYLEVYIPMFFSHDIYGIKFAICLYCRNIQFISFNIERTALNLNHRIDYKAQETVLCINKNFLGGIL